MWRRYLQASPDRAEYRLRWREYLASVEWSDLGNRVIERAGWVCEGCGMGKPLQVHHVSYARAGAERLSDLAALCDECHERIHQAGKSGKVRSM